MTKPFRVCVYHALQEPLRFEPGKHFAFGPVESFRNERVLFVNSRYDWIRGEHVAFLRMTKHDRLTVECQQERQEVVLWSNTPVSSVHLVPLDASLGDSLAWVVAQIALDESQDEHLGVYVGTNIEEYCPPAKD
jgi:hypothetical protein